MYPNDYPPPAPTPPKRNHPWLTIFLLFIFLITGFLGGALAGGAVSYATTRQALADLPTPAPPLAPTPQSPPENGVLQVSNTEIETAITSAVEQLTPSVVTVVATLPGQMSFFGRTPDQQSSGSGVIVSPEGHILTNNHVVAGAYELAVILSNGEERAAEIISTDQYADLAVIKAEGEMPSVATLGNSDLLKPGETVIAIGSPLGTFKNSVTVGVVSATGRRIDTGEGYTMEDLIQTDAAINQGNSGGPLVNLAGEVIGINTLVVRGSGYGSAIAEGLGFAIPANTVRIIGEQIIEKGYFARPYLGIEWQAINPNIANRYRLPVQWGAYVTQVFSGTPAEQAGLQRGDIITKIGEKAIGENTSYVNALFTYQPGQQVTITVARGSQLVKLEVMLGEASGN